MSILPFIHRVKLRNYKSIGRCDVRLGPLAVLVGPNGSGKSNFLDALALTRQALDMTLDHALRERGGINEVRRRSGGHPSNFSIELQFTLGDGVTQGLYSFEVTSDGMRVFPFVGKPAKSVYPVPWDLLHASL